MITLDLPRVMAPRAPRRMSYRGQYGGAAQNRLTADWLTSLLSADQAMKGSLRTLRSRSRQLFQDNGHFAGLRQSIKDNIIGWEGIRLNPRITSPRGKLLTDANDALEAAWYQWGEPITCTADGRSSWWDTTRLALDTWMVDGEAFIRHLPGFANDYGYTIQVIDPDLLDESFNVPPSRNQNEIRMGVEIDSWGRALAYHFWSRHPTDPLGRGLRQRIPAQDVEHLYTQLRPGQTRGLPAATPVLLLSWMLDGFTEAEVVAARIGASGGGGFFWMSAEDAATIGVPVQTEEELQRPMEFEAEPGLSRKLPPGWQHKDWDPAHPNTRFAEFQKAILRMIARGMGVSYATLSGDFSDSNYSSSRMGMLQERDKFRSDQRSIGMRLCSPVYRNFIRYAALAGAVQLPYAELARCLDHEWEYRGWPNIDPKNDIDADAKAIALRVKSRQQICADRGTDYAEVIADLKEEQEIADAAGIDLPLVDAGNSAAVNPGEPGGGTAPPSPPDTAPTNGNGNGNSTAARALLPLEDFQR